VELVFLGTPGFAVPTLERVVEAGHRVLAVYTQPDRPKGRGQQMASSPVKETALRLGLPVLQPVKIRQPEVVEQLRAMRAKAMVVVGYGQIIPQTIIDLPELGIINVHASLLPKYRGAAPIQWAIARGETRTGVTTMRIDAGLDTGDILLMEETIIGEEETAVELGARLAVTGAGLLVRTLEGLAHGAITPVKQDNALATHAPILRKEDGLIDFARPAREIYCRVRGFQPWPGAYTTFRGQQLKIITARAASTHLAGDPGRLHAAGRGLQVACGWGTVLDLIEVQLEGRKPVTAAAFRNGLRPMENEALGGNL